MSDKKKICYIISIVLYVVSIVLAVLSFWIDGNAALALSIPALVIAIAGGVVHYLGVKEKETEPKEEQMSLELNDMNELELKEEKENEE